MLFVCYKLVGSCFVFGPCCVVEFGVKCGEGWGEWGQRSFTDLELRSFILCPASCHSDFCPREPGKVLLTCTLSPQRTSPLINVRKQSVPFKAFQENGARSRFYADFLTAFMFGLDMLQGRLYIPLAIYQSITGQKDIKSYFKWVQGDLRLDKCMWEDWPIWQSRIHQCEINLKGTVGCISFNVDGACQYWQNNLTLVLYCVGKQSTCLYMWTSLPLLQHVVWQEKVMACWYNWAFFDSLIRLFSHW